MPEPKDEKQPDQVDTHTVAKTGDKVETTDKHHEAGKPEVNTEKTTVEKTQE